MLQLDKTEVLMLSLYCDSHKESSCHKVLHFVTQKLSNRTWHLSKSWPKTRTPGSWDLSLVSVSFGINQNIWNFLWAGIFPRPYKSSVELRSLSVLLLTTTLKLTGKSVSLSSCKGYSFQYSQVQARPEGIQPGFHKTPSMDLVEVHKTKVFFMKHLGLTN